MTPDLPAWQPLDLTAPQLPPLPAGGGLVTLLASDRARSEGWGVEAALALSRGWAAEGRRLLLVDLDLERPALHHRLGVDQDEGVTDAFLFGSSFQRIARSVEGGMLFAQAGTVTHAPERILGSGRWDAVADGFRSAGAALVAFAPLDDPSAPLVDRSEAVVLLVASGEAFVAPGGGDTPVLAIFGPEAPARAAPDAAAAAAPRGPAPAEPSVRPPAPTGKAVGPGRPASGRSTSQGRLVLLLIILVAAFLAAAYVGVFTIPGITPDPGGGGGGGGAMARVAQAAVPGAVAADPGDQGPTLTHSLQIGAYPDRTRAGLQAESLGGRRTDLHFVVAPVEVDGEAYHRLLVGPATDSVSAEALRDALSRTLPSEDPGRWIVRETPLAFLVGEAASRAEARARVAELREVGLRPYVLEAAPGAADRPAYRVYVGAYADAAEASHARGILAEAGLGAVSLVARTGRPPR